MATHADSAAARRAALSIVRTLSERGHIAYFAGGCVRDELLELPAEAPVNCICRQSAVADDAHVVKELLQFRLRFRSCCPRGVERRQCYRQNDRTRGQAKGEPMIRIRR